METETNPTQISLKWFWIWRMAFLRPTIKTYSRIISDPKASTKWGIIWMAVTVPRLALDFFSHEFKSHEFKPIKTLEPLAFYSPQTLIYIHNRLCNLLSTGTITILTKCMTLRIITAWSTIQ